MASRACHIERTISGEVTMNTLHRWAWVVVFGLLTSRVEAIELVWSDQGGIHRFDTMGSAGAQQLFEAFDSRGVAFDAARGRLIWSDNLPLGAPLPGGVIRSGRLTGGAAEDLVNQLTFPADVAFDERRQRMMSGHETHSVIRTVATAVAVISR